MYKNPCINLKTPLPRWKTPTTLRLVPKNNSLQYESRSSTSRRTLAESSSFQLLVFHSCTGSPKMVTMLGSRLRISQATCRIADILVIDTSTLLMLLPTSWKISLKPANRLLLAGNRRLSGMRITARLLRWTRNTFPRCWTSPTPTW